MIFRNTLLPLILTLPFLISSAQKLKKNDKLLLSNLEAHVRYLADDKLEGRRTGTPGEKAASDYIASEFSRTGLQPRGDNNGWLQAFTIDQGREISPDTWLSVNDKPLVVNKEFFPLAFSGLGAVNGTPAVAIQESGVPWFVDVRDLMDQGAGNPHFDLYGAIQSKAISCAKKGATALILYNSNAKQPDNLSFDGHDRSKALTIPVLYITREAKRKYLRDESASVDIKIRVGFTDKKRTGHNVVGFLNNGAANTIVLGAHYDHLGYGEESNTLYTGKDRVIFNGADDNASGVAGLIELARMLEASKLKNNNYLFIAFSGEEQGLYGSKYFVENTGADVSKINYMINMDMIGRLNDSTHILTIGGFGTSPVWKDVYEKENDKHLFTFRVDSSGIGPSDHTSFYLKNIPVLFFFTGVHSDYHRPGDDYDKINYLGELQVVKYIFSLVEALNPMGKIAFTRTRDVQQDMPRFSVTLGILPDYSYSGSGVRADGVSDGRPASAAGMKAGDVIVQLGSYPVNSLETYMEALGKFKKGDKTTVKYHRGKDTLEGAVQF